jgi:hypothetical protein
MDLNGQEQTHSIRHDRPCRAGGVVTQRGDRSAAFADAPMVRLIMDTHLEVIHHGAEVCPLRDLYLWKD